MRSPRLIVLAALLAATAGPLAAQATLKVPKQFATIAEALSNAQSGDTVNVAKGTYTESVSVAVAGVTLRGRGAIIDARGTAAGISVTADGVTVSGFTVRNAIGGIAVVADGVVVFNNKIIGNSGVGISVTGDDAAIVRNQVSQSSLTGILYVASTNASDSLIDRNTVRLNGGFGVEAVAGRVVIQKNRIEFNGADGLRLDNASFTPGAANLPDIVGNKILCNGNHGIAIVFSSDGVVIRENTVFQNDGDGILAQTGTNVSATANKVQLNSSSGIHLSTDQSLVDGNRVLENNGAGILMDDGFLGSGTVSGNTSSSNGRDGIEIRGPLYSVEANVCDRNNGDGIDIDTNDTGIVVADNICRRNLHEGIDNSGVGTDLLRNRCTKNGSEGSLAEVDDIPDLAGTGNLGSGSVGDFIDNVFTRGGMDVPQVVDL